MNISYKPYLWLCGYVYYVWSLEIYNWTIGSPTMSEGKNDKIYLPYIL